MADSGDYIDYKVVFSYIFYLIIFSAALISLGGIVWVYATDNICKQNEDSIKKNKIRNLLKWVFPLGLIVSLVIIFLLKVFTTEKEKQFFEQIDDLPEQLVRNARDSIPFSYNSGRPSTV